MGGQTSAAAGSSVGSRAVPTSYGSIAPTPARAITRSSGGGGTVAARILSPVYRFQALRMASLLYPTGGGTITSSSGELGYPRKKEELGGGSIGG